MNRTMFDVNVAINRIDLEQVQSTSQAVSVTFLVLALLGNSLVLLVIYGHKTNRERSIFDVAIVNLSIANLSFVVTSLFAFHSRLTKSRAYCVVFFTLNTSSLNVSMFILSTMAELRRKVVLNPFRPKPSSRSIKLVLCGLWLLALGMSCPVGLVIQASSDQCYEQWPSPILNQVYTVGLTVAVYIVPIALLINAYTRIVLYTKKHAQGMRNMRVTRARDDREVMKASLIIMAIYTILTLPNHLGWLLRVFNVRIANKLILYSWPLVNVQSMCDPFVYGVIMARFRRGFARYFSFGLWRHRMRLAPANPSNMSIQGVRWNPSYRAESEV